MSLGGGDEGEGYYAWLRKYNKRKRWAEGEGEGEASEEPGTKRRQKASLQRAAWIAEAEEEEARVLKRASSPGVREFIRVRGTGAYEALVDRGEKAHALLATNPDAIAARWGTRLFHRRVWMDAPMHCSACGSEIPGYGFWVEVDLRGGDTYGIASYCGSSKQCTRVLESEVPGDRGVFPSEVSRALHMKLYKMIRAEVRDFGDRAGNEARAAAGGAGEASGTGGSLFDWAPAETEEFWRDFKDHLFFDRVAAVLRDAVQTEIELMGRALGDSAGEGLEMAERRLVKVAEDLIEQMEEKPVKPAKR